MCKKSRNQSDFIIRQHVHEKTKNSESIPNDWEPIRIFYSTTQLYKKIEYLISYENRFDQQHAKLIGF